MAAAQSLILAVLGGMLTLDNTAMLQIMVSQPLPACALLGAAGGWPSAGLVMGVSFQVLFARDLPVGSHLPQDGSLVSMAALAAAIGCRSLTGHGGGEVLALAGYLALLLSPLVSRSAGLVSVLNARWTPLVQAALSRGSRRRGYLLAQGGLLFFGLRGLLAVLLFYWAGGAALGLLAASLPAGVLRAARWSFALFPLVGAAHFLSQAWKGRLERLSAALKPQASRRAAGGGP